MVVLMAMLTVLGVDFEKTVTTIRPELHSAGFGPVICGQTAQDMEDIKALGLKAARTHDWALVNQNQRVCDYFHMFPLMRLDARDPENYVFGPTDYLLRRTSEEAGLDIFYRLGTSIEHSGEKIHFNALIPEDFDKVAEIFAGTVRHYNRGWANGHRWNIRYWEIWNEPDGKNNMWCLPESETLSLDEKELEDVRRKRFVSFFVKTLGRLKGEFGDEIRVGGPAMCSYNEGYFRELLSACRSACVTPDFISWHGYTSDPKLFVREADKARRLCDEFGMPACELIVNEWHYFGENYNWDEIHRCADPEVRTRIHEGPDSHNGIRSACFTLATLANLQRSKLDQAYYYGCYAVGDWGYKDAMYRKHKTYHALKLFGGLVRDYKWICESDSQGSVTTMAVRNAAGGKALLVVDYGGQSRRIDLLVRGAGPVARAVLLDDKHDLSDIDVKESDGRICLVKPDFHSAAFLIEFVGK